MRIRPAKKQDCEQIRELHLSAFPDNEGPVVAELATALLQEKSRPATLSLLAEITEDKGAVVGHVAFSPVNLVNPASSCTCLPGLYPCAIGSTPKPPEAKDRLSPGA